MIDVAPAVEALHRAATEHARRAAPPDARWLRAEVRRRHPLATDAQVDEVVGAVEARRSGLGPLAPLLADPRVSDVLVNGDGAVWVERRGVLARTDVSLGAAGASLLVEQIVGPLGRRADRSSPIAEARLADGSRVHVVLPPLSVDGPCLAIRRFAADRVALDDFAPPPVVELLRWAVAARANLVVCGATGAGKTTLLNALASGIEASERIITVEDAAELRLPGEHVVRLESRPASADGLGAVSIRELVRSALRMRPDRLVVGEVRGAEALDMLQAMGTGHDGSLSTVHARSGEEALRRLEVLVLLGGVALPLVAVRQLLADAVDLVVHVARGAEGARRVAAVHEVEAGRALGARPLVLGDVVVGLPRRPPRSAAAGDPDPAWLSTGSA